MKKIIFGILLLFILVGTVLGAVTFYTPMDTDGNDTVTPLTGYLTGDAYIGSNDCLKGSCLVLDGNGDYDNFAQIPIYNDDDNFTVRCAWKTNTVNPTVHPDPVQVILSNHHSQSPEGGWYIGIYSSSPGVKFFIGSYGIAGTSQDTILNASTWYVSTVVYDETGPDKFRYYLNGNPETHSGTENDILPFPGADPYTMSYIGRWSSTPGLEWEFNGTIDECKIWNEPLTDQEVLNDYTQLTCTPHWTCIGYESPIGCGCQDLACNTVGDINTCGIAYTGNYSEFDPQTLCSECPIEPTPEVQPTRRGSNNAAYIVQQNLAKQAESPKPTNFFDAIVQVIHNIRKALGLEQ